MARKRTPDRSPPLDDPPPSVEVTILSGASGPTPRERIAAGARTAPRRWVIGFVLVIVAAGALIATSLPAESGSGAQGVSARAHEPGAAGVAAAYGYPLRCLTVTFSRVDADYARADVEHTGQCWRYRGDVLAVFKRVAGAWRALLRGGIYSCPVGGMPAAVQLDLAVCPQTKGPLGLV